MSAKRSAPGIANAPMAPWVKRQRDDMLAMLAVFGPVPEAMNPLGFRLLPVDLGHTNPNATVVTMEPVGPTDDPVYEVSYPTHVEHNSTQRHYRTYTTLEDLIAALVASQEDI